MHRLRKAAASWLSQLLIAWVLALTAGAVNACVDLPDADSHAVHAHAADGHRHAQKSCDNALGHSASAPAKTADAPKDARPPLQLLVLLPLPPSAPAQPVLSPVAGLDPAPPPGPRYLETARLRI